MWFRRSSFRKRLAYHGAAPMFWLSVVFLANSATLLVLWVDVPRVHEAYLAGPAEEIATIAELNKPLEEFASRTARVAWFVALLLWPIFVLEFVVSGAAPGRGPRFSWLGLLACACPPLRLAAPSPEMGGRVWLPGLRWIHATDDVRLRLERVFGLPMIFIALMILPILLVEFGLKEHIADRPWLRFLLHASTGTIWFAFALEFILMCSVAPKKIQYCKDNWIDLAIILLPLVSFLRSLRLVRATRLAKLAKVQHLTKMSRVYRLRGLAVKGLRGLLLFEVLYRLLRITPEKRIAGLRAQLEEKRREVRNLELQIHAMEQRIEVDGARAEAPLRGEAQRS